jgi:hypothetical protein
MLRTLDAPPTVSTKRRPRMRDPDDLPYIDLQVAIQASAIYTEDLDLSAMNAPVVGRRVVSDAREYARAASVSFTITIGGTVVCTAGIGLLVAAGQLVAALARRVRSLPEGVQLVLLGTGLVILLHAAARASFNGQLQRLAAWLLERKPAGTPHPLATDYLSGTRQLTCPVGMLPWSQPKLPGCISWE